MAYEKLFCCFDDWMSRFDELEAEVHQLLRSFDYGRRVFIQIDDIRIFLFSHDFYVRHSPHLKDLYLVFSKKDTRSEENLSIEIHYVGREGHSRFQFLQLLGGHLGFSYSVTEAISLKIV